MRLLLDAHISLRLVGTALETAGHDVRGIAQAPGLDALRDEDVLELAAAERRILITGDVKDFVPLVRAWGREGRTHSGCVLVARVAERHRATVASEIVAALAGRSEESWENLVVFLPRAHTTS